MAKLLEGYKVIDLSTYVAAPTCARLFADWGAEVIKIEPPSGDVWRYFGVTAGCPATEEENPIFDLYNANKKNLCLNLKKPEGKEIFFKLLEDADVFITNNRPQALRKMGIDYDSIKDRFPRLVYALLTGYGLDGPDKDDPGFDAVAYWSRSGSLADFAEAGGDPMVAPPAFGDASTGTALFGGICAALLAREKTGKGDFVNNSLYGTAIWYGSMLSVVTQPPYNDPYPKQRYMVNPLVTNYKCSDGEWVMLCILQYDRFFRPLCEAIGAPQLADDPRFGSMELCMKNRKDLIDAFEAAFIQVDSATVCERLHAIDCVYGRLRHAKEVHNDPQALANDNVRPFTFKSGRTINMPVPPVKVGDAGLTPYEAAPLLGEHSVSIVKALGYSDEEVKKLVEEGAIVQNANSQK